jgi:glycosyltransferase involved in cell wall biosynthesis
VRTSVPSAWAVVSAKGRATGAGDGSYEDFLQTDAPQAMADAIVDLLQDSALRQRIGGAADDFVRENYGSESVSRQFESICRRVVARASSPGSVPVSPFPSSISPL